MANFRQMQKEERETVRPTGSATDADYLRRAIQLARLGEATVRRNPLVGAVLVARERIIGEGYYRQEGGAHAEIQALNRVSERDRPLLAEASLYVTLEPCCIYGRTPPCSSAILAAGIPRVVLSTLDLTPGVAGQSVALLRAAGVEVVTEVLREAGARLAAPRNVFVSRRRPYVRLKWAQSPDGFLGRPDERVAISNAYTGRLTHRWRAASTAILVGTRTALLDRPRLDVRHYFGTSPVRVVLDRELRLPAGSPLLSDGRPTVVVTESTTAPNSAQVRHWTIAFDETLLPSLLARLADEELATLLVEGGAETLRRFIAAELWDEALVYTGGRALHGGVRAPTLPVSPVRSVGIADNRLALYYPPARG